jgi:fatty acid desaturase
MLRCGVQRFSTFVGSSRTVFNMMLGEFGDAHADLFDASVDAGLLIFPAYLFFYSFMCIVFLVMLNFLLAIIVDAFVDVKPKDGDDRVRWVTTI